MKIVQNFLVEKIMKLTNEQTSVLHSVYSDIKKNKNEISIGGYAGVGKTTLVNYLTKFYPNYGICAYTGKAANVLRKKGVSGASTIHSRIYKPSFDNGVMYFDLNLDPGCEGFIVDEASMVSEVIYNDLKSFNLPIVFVGDHGQLEPVDSKFNLMLSPDYRLEEIHRNAGPIAKFAEHLRKGLNCRGFREEGSDVEFVSKLSDDLLTEVSQVICAFNKTRVSINSQIRNALGFKGVLNVGERIMCLKNNRTQGLFNGMQGTVISLYNGPRGRKLMDFEFDGFIYSGVPYEEDQFGKEKYKIKHGGGNSPNPFDYAYCVTCHKAQGDEFEKTLVIEQRCDKWDHRRWSYTAASRAKQKLYWKMS
jgi:exodeoxyribonuclease-5